MRFLSVLKSILLPVGLIVLGVFAVVTMNADAPAAKKATLSDPSPSSFRGDAQLNLISSALSDFDANNRNADSAPQQQVVAGWATKDLLSIVGLQNAQVIDGIEAVNANLIELQKLQSNVNETIEASTPPVDNRPRRLLALGVLAICWFGMWSAVPTFSGRGRGNAGSLDQVTAANSESMSGATSAPTTTPEAPVAEGPWNSPGATA